MAASVASEAAVRSRLWGAARPGRGTARTDTKGRGEVVLGGLRGGGGLVWFGGRGSRVVISEAAVGRFGVWGEARGKGRTKAIPSP